MRQGVYWLPTGVDAAPQFCLEINDSAAARGLDGRQQTVGHVYAPNPSMLTDTQIDHTHHIQTQRRKKKIKTSGLCVTDFIIPMEAILKVLHTQGEKFRCHKFSCKNQNSNNGWF